MGTYRTNKAVAKAAYKIDRFEWDSKRECIILKTTPTRYKEFASPVHTEHKWVLGELEEHIESDAGRLDISEFKGEALYKVVTRSGDNFVLLLELTAESEVYAGASEGPGVYFETDLKSALAYCSCECVELNWTDGIPKETHEIYTEGEMSCVRRV